MEKIFETLTKHIIDNKLDSIILKDPQYKKLLTQIDIAYDKIDRKDIYLDELLSCYNTASSYYASKCYNQGYYDCVKLLKELNIL